ncbi:MAG: hypothetical protein R3D02_00440 [Hyphomicrobiales bacterium]
MRKVAAMILAILMPLGVAAPGEPRRGPDRVGDRARPPDCEAVCGDCHAVLPGAVSPLPIAPPLYLLTETYPLEWIRGSARRGMVTGHENMPEIVLDPIQIDEFLAFLASIQRPRRAP